MSTTPPGWHPDPQGRHELRYWDGSMWTPHVSNAGVQAVDPPVAPPVPSTGTTVPTGSLLDMPTLFVNQKAKLIELTSEYKIFDPNGAQIGMVRQEGQSKAKKALRLLSSLDQFMTHKYVLHDFRAGPLAEIVRPAKVFKSRFEVRDLRAGGALAGQIVQENVFGKKRFALTDGTGAPLGYLLGESWVSWDFRVEDSNGTVVATVNKQWVGIGREMFTTADHYALQVLVALPDPFRLLVYTAATSIDTALKQDSQGFN